MKKFLSCLLLMLALGSVLGLRTEAVEATGSCGENVTWHQDTETGVLTISGTGEMDDLSGPNMVWLQGVKTVVITEGVTSIGNAAFRDHTNLTDVQIPSSVKTIGSNAFENCKKLRRIRIPDSITSIGSYAFLDCINLTSVNIPDSVTDIRKGTFSGCESLTHVSIPESVTSIGSYAFYICTGLTSVNIPKDITAIEEYAFAGCVNLKSIHIPDSVASIGKAAFCDSGLRSMTIPKNVTSIGEKAFAYCDFMRSVTVHGNAVSVGKGAFEDCNNLKGIAFAGNAPNIAPGAFYHTTANAYYSRDNASWTSDVLLNYSGQLTWIPLCQEHTMSEWVIGQHVTIYTDGMNHRNCTVCGWEETEYIPAPKHPFTDVSAEQYFHTPVLWAVKNEITNGIDATHFGPDAGCTRAHVVTFLWRAAGCPISNSRYNPFTDVAPGAYYYDAVLWAVEQGITNGLSATAFGPDQTCTRGQIVTFLWRFRQAPGLNRSDNPFADVPADQYYYTAVLWAVENEITNGMGNGLFAPNDPCTRGQIVTFLYRCTN